MFLAGNFPAAMFCYKRKVAYRQTLNDLCYVGLHNFLLTTEMDYAFILNDSEILKKWQQ